MGRVRLGVKMALVAVSVLVPVALVEVGSANAAGRPPVLRLSLTGVVDPFMASYIQRGIHAAASHASQRMN